MRFLVIALGVGVILAVAGSVTFVLIQWSNSLDSIAVGGKLPDFATFLLTPTSTPTPGP
jgi:hypothetical protein